MGLVAGIDAGTQSLKVLVYDPQAQAVAAVTSAPLTLDSGADGSREQAPADWVSALRDCFAGSTPRCALASSHWRYRGSSMGSCRLMMLARYWRRPSCGATPAPRPNASRSWTPWADSNGPSRWRATRSWPATQRPSCPDPDPPCRRLRAAGDHPAATRLPEFRVDRAAVLRAWRCVRNRLAGRAHTHLVAGTAARHRS